MDTNSSPELYSYRKSTKTNSTTKKHKGINTSDSNPSFTHKHNKIIAAKDESGIFLNNVNPRSTKIFSFHSSEKTEEEGGMRRENKPNKYPTICN